MNRSQLFRMSVLTFSFAILSVANSARADDSDKPRGKQPVLRFTTEEGEGNEGIVVQIGGQSEYWLGLAVAPLDEEERAKAKLPEGQGLEIEQVMPNSPAAKAGLREEDIVLRVGDKAKVGNLADLQKLVAESEGKPMILEVLRDGKKTKIAVTPAKRAEAQRIVIVEEERENKKIEEKEGSEKREPERGNRILSNMEQMMQRAQAQANQQRAGQPRQGLQAMPGGLAWTVQPGPAWTVHPATFPEDLNVTIKKKGSKPARIKVTRGIQSWTVNENEIGQLPPDIRGYVLHMMSGHGAQHDTSGMPGQPGMMMIMPQPGAEMMPGHPQGPRGGQPGGANPNPTRAAIPAGQVQREIQLLNQKLHELQEQLKAQRSKESDHKK